MLKQKAVMILRRRVMILSQVQTQTKNTQQVSQDIASSFYIYV